MSNKNSYSELKELLKLTTMELTRDTHKWQDFLKSSSKLYKYNFSEQISIYAQNPKATACADFNLWNEKMNRRIKRGEKSIRFVDDKSGQIKHVFDISQTYANERSKTPYLWQNNDENESVIIKALHDRYDVPKDNLINMIFSSAKSAAEDIKSDYLSELKYVVSDSLLADFDDLNLNVIFSRILENSVAYSLLARCDINPDLYLTREDFADLYNFSNLETLSVLGAATSEASEQILREIEKAVKSHEIKKIRDERGMSNETQKDVGSRYTQGKDSRRYTPHSVSRGYEVLSRSDGGERNNLQAGRANLSVSSSIGITGYESGHREVRSLEAGISGEVQERLSDTIKIREQVESLSSGNQRNSTQSDKSDGGRNVDERASTTKGSGFSSTRSAQELSDRISRGDNSERDDLHLNNETAEENVTSAVILTEPIVTIKWSEHPALTEGEEIPLSVANALFRELDLKQNTERNNPDLNVGWYKKTAFSIKSIINGEEHTYEGRQDLGDGEGSLLNHIKNHFLGLAEDNGFHNHYKKLGDKEYQEFLSEIDFALNTLIPYYESHIELINIKAEAEKNNILESLYVHEGKSLELLNNKENITEAINEIHDIRKTQDDIFVNSAVQLTLFDDENITENNSNQHNLAIISQKVIDEVLSSGGKELNSVHNIIAHYQKGKSIEDNAEFLKNEFKTSLNDTLAKTDTQKRDNFKIKDEDFGVKGRTDRLNSNIQAISLLKQLEKDKRIATPEEQEVLAGYTGWGSLPQVFDERNNSFANQREQLRELLTEDEYNSAMASTLNAHYTAPVVISAIYEAIDKMGFESGNILEPSCGTGNFFGLLPEKMQNSKLYGVELDSITGRIAQQLYPNANIAVTGFEKKEFPDNFFDVTIGNVPFGGFKVHDKHYDKHNFLIHDYFIAKSLDKVRPGGVVAIVTSKGTMDKKNPSVRKYIAQRAELVGAVRLPNNAFKANAGTEVTADILFFQKRDRMIDIEPDWIHLGKNENGLPINQYFIDNPQMVLGEIIEGNKLYGDKKETDTTCVPFEGAVLKEQLKEAVSSIKATIPEKSIDTVLDDVKIENSIPADPNIKNLSYAVVDDNLYYRQNSTMDLVEVPVATAERIKGMVEIRDCLRTLIDNQLNNESDIVIENQQNLLNSVYDDFTKKHGHINERANQKAFRDDSSLPLLSSLENFKDGKFVGKADIFTKRTIKPIQALTSVETATEALAVSIAEKGRIDMPFMSELSSKSEAEIESDLKGVIFRDIQCSKVADNISTDVKVENFSLVTADEYLSGNVREKLMMAKALQSALPESEKNKVTENINALQQAMPKALQASDIDVRLGATWIDTNIINKFIYETLNTPFFMQEDIVTRFSPSTTQWNISNKSKDNKNVKARTQFGTNRKNAYQLIEDCLNLRDTKVWDKIDTPDGVKSELNRKETMLAQQKQELLRNSFKDWVFKDPVRREALVEKYNVLFNSTKPREYDGSHLSFVGMNSEIKLRSHQKNAVAHAIYGGNTLFAHEVGAGKTFEMIATAMESKRLGLCNKSLIAVPNHLTEQMGNDFMKLYPAANILVAKKEDFSKENRKKLCAKIATGDFDAVIIGHSQLIKIPVSPERQERLMKEQIHEIVNGIKELKVQKAEPFQVKQLEKTKKSLEAKLKKLVNSPNRDDVVYFEELGIDKLIVDEAHLFKNLYLNTKMRNISGISTNDNVQKTADLYMKCQYLDEITGGKGIVFATGTPVSNSMTEIYSMMKYLQSDMLNKAGLKHFDAWAANFGETVTAMELAPEGTGYRAKTRFAKFFNLPELMSMFKECADIKTADVLNLETPECSVQNVVVKPTELQSELVQGLSERAAKVHNREVDPTEDNMLKITTDGRKIGLDQRLINPLFPDEEGTKVNVCVDNVFKIWEDTKSDSLTQLIFCDFSTPKTDGSFNLYDDIRNKLIARGVPKEEIAFIHEAKSETQKDNLFAKVRSGEVRVLIGSTSKMGAGTNIQDKLVASHDLDCPWKPADMEQRRGRMVRQGNTNKKVQLFRYVTEATFDAYLFQTLENKQKFIGQIMTSKAPVRSCEDVDEAALSYAEVKALCTGNPDIKEKMELDVEVSKLKMLKSNYVNQQYALEDSVLKHYPKEIAKLKELINSYKKDIETIKLNPITDKEKLLPMKIDNHTYTDKEAAGKALLNARTLIPVDKKSDPIPIGSYRGFDMFISLQSDFLVPYFRLDFKGAKTHSIELGDDIYGNLTRINNALDGMEKQLNKVQDRLFDIQNQLTFAKAEMSKPFPQEAELQQKLLRLEELDIRISMEKGDGKSNVKKAQPKENSVLNKLEKMKKEVSTNIRSNPNNEMSL